MPKKARMFVMHSGGAYRAEVSGRDAVLHDDLVDFAYVQGAPSADAYEVGYDRGLFTADQSRLKEAYRSAVSQEHFHEEVGPEDLD